MKRQFDLPIVAAAATAMLSVAGCGSKASSNNNGWVAEQGAHFCVDSQNRRIPDGQCGSSGSQWYFVGGGGHIPPFGGYASGGGFFATSGASYPTAEQSIARAGATSRGGFGFFGGRGGGGGGGGE